MPGLRWEWLTIRRIEAGAEAAGLVTLNAAGSVWGRWWLGLGVALAALVVVRAAGHMVEPLVWEGVSKYRRSRLVRTSDFGLWLVIWLLSWVSLVWGLISQLVR